MYSSRIGPTIEINNMKTGSCFAIAIILSVFGLVVVVQPTPL